MFYVYLTLLLITYTNNLHVESTPLTLKEKVQSIFDASENVNDAQILESLSNYFQNDKKDEDEDDITTKKKDRRELKAYMKKYDIAEYEPVSPKFARNQEIGFFRSPSQNPGLTSYKHRRLWELRTSSDEELKSEDWPDKRKNQKFENNSPTPSRGDVNVVVDRPWEVKCGEPNQHYKLWGTCTLPKKCDEDYRIYLGDQFCDRTEICCAHADQNTVFKHGASETTNIEDEASLLDENDGMEVSVNKKKLTWLQEIDPVRDISKIESNVEKMESDIEKIDSVLDKMESDVEKIESKLEKMERNSENLQTYSLKKEADRFTEWAKPIEEKPKIFGL